MNEMSAAADVRGRHQWFAVWNWKSRKLAIGMTLTAALATYVELPVIVTWLHLNVHPVNMDRASLPFWPLAWAYENIPVVQEFYERQLDPMYERARNSN